MHPYLGPVRKPVPVLGQRQVIVGLDHVLERGLGLIPYHGSGPAPHRPGLQPALGLGRLHPAIHARASDREPSCDYLARLPSLQRRRNHTPAQIA